MQQISHEQARNTTFCTAKACFPTCLNTAVCRDADCDYAAYKYVYSMYNMLHNKHNIAEQMCMNNIDIAQDKLCLTFACATCRCS